MYRMSKGHFSFWQNCCVQLFRKRTLTTDLQIVFKICCFWLAFVQLTADQDRACRVVPNLRSGFGCDCSQSVIVPPQARFLSPDSHTRDVRSLSFPADNGRGLCSTKCTNWLVRRVHRNGFKTDYKYSATLSAITRSNILSREIYGRTNPCRCRCCCWICMGAVVAAYVSRD